MADISEEAAVSEPIMDNSGVISKKTALIVIIGSSHLSEFKNLSLERIVKGIKSWDKVTSELDISDSLRDFVNSAPSATDIGCACLSVSYQCPNMECISWSYVCDGINDCGYLQSGSDEIGCNGLGWSKAKKIGVGVGTGVGVFCVIFFGIGFTDIIIRERARRKYLEEMERKRRLAKKRKAEAKAAGQLDVSANTSRRGSSNFLATPGLMSRQVSSTSTVTT